MNMVNTSNQTVSITFGAAADGSSIVLPRGHELIKHLEALLPSKAVASGSPSSVTQVNEMSGSSSSSNASHALSALAALSQDRSMSQAATLPALPRHLYAHSGSSPSHASAYHSDHSDSSSTTSSTQRANGLTTTSPSTTTGVRRRRAGTASQSSGKKCQIPDCDKISVSRGLCRGHGGGRRCQHMGCAKGAQSRSDFCWAHGGGQRCEVKNCMRSRKSKRFCVAHLNWENSGTALAPAHQTHLHQHHPYQQQGSLSYVEVPKALRPRMVMPTPVPEPISARTLPGRLPSLQQALRMHNFEAPPYSVAARSIRTCGDRV